MSPLELEQYLHEHIPLSRAMGVSVDRAGPDEVRLRAPLAPNINHRDTVFGGSASAVCILAAWSLVHARLRTAGVAARIVIQRNSMEYLLPVDGEFTASAGLEDAEAWTRFERALRRKGRARIEVGSVLEFGGRIAGRMTGEFVAMR